MVAGSWNSPYAQEEPVTAEQGPQAAAQTQARQSLKLHISADMMAGIDDSFDAAIFLRYLSSTANERGVRAHSFSSAHVTGLRLNGKSMSEASISAAIAGHFGVPVIMVSPLRLELSLKHYRSVELLAYLPNVERINSHTMGFTGQDISEISGFLAVALGYSVDLQP